MKLKTFRKGGIHPAPSKLTSGMPIVEIGVSSEIRLELAESIGVPARCIVKPGQSVSAGEMIAEAAAFVSAPVHSPVAGTVKRIEKLRDPQGFWREAVVIATEHIETAVDEAEEALSPRTQDEVDALTPKEIIDIVGNAGVVGLGGATFPTRVKLSIPEGKKAEVVILNGAECEPFLTCDEVLMCGYPDRIVAGCRLIMKAVGVERAIIGIEANKPQAIAAFRRLLKGCDDISVQPLKMKYPQGGEKQLIYALTGKEVPEGGLPVDAGAVVDNVATAYAVYDAIYNRKPLTQRVVTVTGPHLKKPGNYLVKIGTTISSIIEAAGGLPEDTGKVIAGGPMMGKAMSRLDAPTTKAISGILVLPESMSKRRSEEPCIRCAKCVSVCPMGLEPYQMMNLSIAKRFEDITKLHVMSCLECGSCSYVCPSHRPLLDYIRYAKQEIRKMPKK